MPTEYLCTISCYGEKSGAYGIARADGDGNFSIFYLEGTDSLAMSTIATEALNQGGALLQVVCELP